MLIGALNVVQADELLAAGKQGKPTNARHAHGWVDNNGRNKWDKWTVYIQEKNKTVWEAVLHVANSRDGEKILYDIRPIKKVESAGKTAANTTKNKLPQSGTDVKDNFSRDSEGRELTQEQVDRLTSYDALVNRPDMTVTEIDDTVQYAANGQTRKALVEQAIKNAAAIGKTDSNGGVSVHVDDIGRDVLLSRNSLKHGLDRRLQDNAAVTLNAGSILKNSVLINKLTPQIQNASESYVLLGAAKDKNGVPTIVEFVVNSFSNEVTSVDVLYSANAKKESAVLNAPSPTGYPLAVTDSTISIARLLDFARDYFPDVLPESVLRHYGFTERPGGKLGESALFSREVDLSNTELQEKLRALLEEYGAIEPGENPFRDANVPRRTSENTKVSQTVRTILEAQVTPDEAVPTIQKLLVKGAFDYTPYADEAAIADAEATIKHKGFQTALLDWTKEVGTGTVSKKNTALGFALYNAAAQAGDVKAAVDILDRIIQHQRSAAQAVQATRILKQMSPSAQLYAVVRSVEVLHAPFHFSYLPLRTVILLFRSLRKITA